MMLTEFEGGKKYVFRKALHDEELPECAHFTWPSEVDGMTVKVSTRRIGFITGLSICPEWCEEAQDANRTV